MNRSRVRTLVIALVVALISRVTGDMLLSKSSYGKAFGNPLTGARSPSAFGGQSRPTAIRVRPMGDGASAIDRAARAVAHALWSAADTRSWATSPEQISAAQYAAGPVSLVGPLPVNGGFVDGPPASDAGPTAGGGGPGGAPYVGGPPANPPPWGGGGFLPPPGGGATGGGGPVGSGPVGSGPGGGGLGGGPSGGGPGSPPAGEVPEPSDWSMLVFGLLALGVPLRLSRGGARRFPLSRNAA